MNYHFSWICPELFVYNGCLEIRFITIIFLAYIGTIGATLFLLWLTKKYKKDNNKE